MKIIRFVNPNLRFFEGEGGDGGGGAVDSGAGESAPVDNSQGEATQESGGGRNPAWDPVLSLIPSQLHEGVVPHLKKWDENFQTELQKVQSQYEPLKPLLESGADAETLQRALGFYQLAEKNPQRVYEEMAKYYGFGQDQGQQEQVQDSDDEFSLDGEDDEDPRYAALKQNQEAIAQVLLSQHEKEQMQQFEQQVEQEVATIKESHPDMSEEDEVMMYRIAVANNCSLTDAAQELFKYTESKQQAALKTAPHAPSVMSANGVIPGQQPIDPRKLDSKGTKDLVRSILENRQ